MELSQGYRDLIWVAESQSLVRDELTTVLLSQGQRDRLRRGDYIEAFDRFLTRHDGVLSHKVGLYFELLVEFLITHVLQGRMIERGQQVMENGRTVGEVDFIFELNASIWHLETAVKFYLFVPEGRALAERLVGPNSKDNFEAKMNRLFDHQLPLSRVAFPEVTKRVAFVKGRIFYPHSISPSNAMSALMAGAADPLNVSHEQGVWCRAADCKMFFSQVEIDSYVIRKKPHWLANVHRTIDCADVLTCSQMTAYLAKHFHDSKRPLMISSLSETDGNLTEVRRIFVVDDSWPW